MAELEWIETEIAIRDLKEIRNNPRIMTENQFDALVQSLRQDGYHQRILIDQNNRIVGGHARKRALREAGYSLKQTIKVLKASRKLTKEEFRRIAIRDNLQYGDWDVDLLANEFELDELMEWGMPEDLLAGMVGELDELITDSKHRIIFSPDDNELKIIERALESTEEKKRVKALVRICESYIHER